MDHRGTLVIWNANDDFDSLKQLTFDVPLSAIAVSSTGNYLAICEHDSPAASDGSPAKFCRCHRLDLRNLGKPLASITHNQIFRFGQAAFTYSPEHLVATDVMGNTRCWDMDRSAEVYRLQSGLSEDIDTCTQRNWLALGVRDGTVRICDLNTGEPITAPLEHGGGGVRSAKFSRDGEFLATGGLDETVQFWKLGILPQRLAIWPQCGTIDQLQIAKNSEFALTKSRTRDRSQPAEVFLRKLPEMRSRKLGSIPTETVGFTPDSEFNRSLVQSLDKKTIKIYSRDGKFLKKGPSSPSEERILDSFCFSRDGRTIVVIEGTGLGENRSTSLRQWDIQSESYRESILGKEDPDFDWIGGQISDDLYLLGSSAWRASVFNARKAEVVATLAVSGRPYGISVSKSRNEFCVGDSSGAVRFFNCATYEPTHSPLKLNGIVRHTCYSGDGKWLAVVCKVKDEHVLHFWLLDGEPPFHSVEMRFPYVGSRLYPLGARSFIFEADDKKIHAIDLPFPSLDLEHSELRTWVAIGHRRSKTGQLDLIPSAQYREYRQRLTDLTTR